MNRVSNQTRQMIRFRGGLCGGGETSPSLENWGDVPSSGKIKSTYSLLIKIFINAHTFSILHPPAGHGFAIKLSKFHVKKIPIGLTITSRSLWEMASFNFKINWQSQNQTNVGWSLGNILSIISHQGVLTIRKIQTVYFIWIRNICDVQIPRTCIQNR